MSFTGGTLACNATCDGWVTTGCTTNDDCGNNTLDTGELCDGSLLDGNDCESIAGDFGGGDLACNATCDGWVTTGCTSVDDCGNDALDSGETCDGSLLNGNECATIGGIFTGGDLACNATCDGWVTTACTTGGDSCSNPLVVTGDASFVGTDITADFTDQLDLQDASCDGGYGVPATGAVEAVFEVALAAGDKMVVAESGDLDGYLMVVSTCDSSAVCAAVSDTPDELSYTATAAETVYVIVGAYVATPSSTDYAIEFSFPVCGNGIVETGEQCDDVNGTPASGDGCSDTCEIEFGYECDNTSTSVCALYPAFGTFNGDCESNIQQTGGALATGDAEFFLLTLTASAIVTGTVSSPDGDMEFYIVNDGGQAYSFETAGDEIVTASLGAGTYALVAYAYDAVSSFSIDLATECPEDLGSLGDGGAVNQVEAAMAAGELYYYKITLTEDVMMNGTLTSTSGDADFYIYGAQGFVTGHFEDGNEIINTVLGAGTYYLQVNAYMALPDFTLNLAFTTPSIPDIGTFAAGDAIGDQVGGVLAQQVCAHYTITFTNDVLLSGTLGGNATGDVDLYLYNADRNYVESAANGSETWTDQPVSAGTYYLQVQAYGDVVDAYTLTLATTTP